MALLEAAILCVCAVRVLGQPGRVHGAWKIDPFPLWGSLAPPAGSGVARDLGMPIAGEPQVVGALPGGGGTGQESVRGTGIPLSPTLGIFLSSGGGGL